VRIREARVFVGGLSVAGQEVAKNMLMLGVAELFLCDATPVEDCHVDVSPVLKTADVGQRRSTACARRLVDMFNGTATADNPLDNRPKNKYSAKIPEWGTKHPCGVSFVRSCGEDPLHVRMLRTVNIVILVNASPDVMLHTDEFCRAHKPTIQTVYVDARGLGGYVCATPLAPLRELLVRREGRDVGGGEAAVNQQHLRASVEKNAVTLHSRAQRLHIAFQGQNTFANIHGHLPPVGDQASATEAVQYGQAFCNDYGWPELDSEGQEFVRQATLYSGSPDFYPCAAILAGEASRRAVLLSILCFEDNEEEGDDLRPDEAGSRIRKLRDLAKGLGGYAYFDCLELRPGDVPAPLPSSGPVVAALLGAKTVSKMQKSRLVAIGLGGIGGECVKMLACLGFASADAGGGCLVIDSGLVADRHCSRQWAYVAPTPTAEVSKVTEFCRQIKGTGKKTNLKGVFSHVDDTHSYPPSLKGDSGPEADPLNERWGNVDVVITCVDSDACAEISDLCVLHETPNIVATCYEGYGYVQTFVPHRSLTFGDTELCTESASKLHSSNTFFPDSMKECVEGALYRFEELFSNGVRDFMMCMANFDTWAKRATGGGNAPPHIQIKRLQTLQFLVTLFTGDADGGVHYLDCLRIARWVFDAWFDHLPQQLLHSFGRAGRTPETDGGNARPMEFHPGCGEFVAFVTITARLLAAAFDVGEANILATPAKDVRRAIEDGLRVPRFEAKDGVTLSTDGTGVLCCRSRDAEDVHSLVGSLRGHFDGLNAIQKDTKCASLTFDSNDDLHVAFTCATANMMRQSLGHHGPTDHETGSECIDFHSCRCLLYPTHGPPAHDAGLLAGLMCIELIKLLQKRGSEVIVHSKVKLSTSVAIHGQKILEGRTCSIDTTALPPSQPVVRRHDSVAGSAVRAIPDGFTKWDKEVVRNGPMTIRQLVNYLSRKHSIHVWSIRCKGVELYRQPVQPRNGASASSGGAEEVLQANVAERFEVLSGITLSSKCHFLFLDLECTDQDEEGPAVMPQVKFFFQ
jgi:molybdopterin/thiamine biosynthesis adenylyltransferase